MLIPSVRTTGAAYTALAADSQNSYWPSLKQLRNPTEYCIMLDTSGHTLSCGAASLVDAVTKFSGTDDPMRAVDRHAGSVNCLFGDFHVESVTEASIRAQAAISCAIGQPFFEMN